MGRVALACADNVPDEGAAAGDAKELGHEQTRQRMRYAVFSRECTTQIEDFRSAHLQTYDGNWRRNRISPNTKHGECFHRRPKHNFSNYTTRQQSNEQSNRQAHPVRVMHVRPGINQLLHDVEVVVAGSQYQRRLPILHRTESRTDAVRCGMHQEIGADQLRRRQSTSLFFAIVVGWAMLPPTLQQANAQHSFCHIF